jgi:pyrroloquinoline quinone biosynthesis protein D
MSDATRVGPDFVPRLARKVRLREDRHEDRTMLVYPERGLLLNESAAAIARMCDGTRSIAEIALVLAHADASADRAVIERDVLAFVADLKRKGLVE